MKQLFISITSLAIISTAYAGELPCNSDIHLPTRSVTGTCSAGRCSGSLSPVSIAASGICDDGRTFTAATQQTGGGSLVGKCENEKFLGVGSGLFVKFLGTCSASGTFVGSSKARFQYALGTCEENGTFTATISEMIIPVSGNCD